MVREGVLIPADSPVLLMLGTANREVPSAADAPNEMNLNAKPTHLGFGGGIHRCLGSHLARRELRLTVEEFHARIPEYRLAGTTGPDHRKQFQVDVVVGGRTLAQGSGSSKKDAEQEAAKLALVVLQFNRSR